MQFVVNQWRTNTVNSDDCVTRLVMSMDRSPHYWNFFPTNSSKRMEMNWQLLETTLEVIFVSDYLENNFLLVQHQLWNWTISQKLHMQWRTHTSPRQESTFHYCSPRHSLSKQTAQESNRSSLDHFSLETDRRLTNQTSTSSSEYSCKVLQFQHAQRWAQVMQCNSHKTDESWQRRCQR